jgi:hypothetical protein
VHVQVAADLLELDERWRCARVPCLAQLGRDERQAERVEERLLVRCVWEGPQRFDERGRARRADELRAEAGRIRDHELHGHAFDRHAHRTPRVPLDDGHDLRQFGESFEHRR